MKNRNGVLKLTTGSEALNLKVRKLMDIAGSEAIVAKDGTSTM